MGEELKPTFNEMWSKFEMLWHIFVVQPILDGIIGIILFVFPIVEAMLDIFGEEEGQS